HQHGDQCGLLWNMYPMGGSETKRKLFFLDLGGGHQYTDLLPLALCLVRHLENGRPAMAGNFQYRCRWPAAFTARRISDRTDCWMDGKKRNPDQGLKQIAIKHT